ncbi:MAG: PAS domain S-box protein [Verrucomicrobia bacterium]|nr:PAS domain S-box protein [Verrucomicrobiota bacterium]MCF7708169.1 PAS domain S-box protein [Verrucomicrobiota bacterium]
MNCHDGYDNAENARQNQKELENLFELSPDLICILEINSAIILKVNPAFKTVLGYEECEFDGRSLFELSHPHDYEKTKAAFTSTLAKGDKLVDFENRCRCKDGAYRWLSWSMNTRRSRGIVFAVARDITDIKKYVAKIERLNSVLSSIRDINQAITQISNLDTLIKRAREILLTTRGYKEVWIELMDVSGEVALKEGGLGPYQPGQAEVAGLLENNKPSVTECSGDDRVWRIMIPFENGGRVGLLGVLSENNVDKGELGLLKEISGDIAFARTKLHIEKELVKNEQFLNEIFESIQDGVSVLDKDLNVVRVNNVMRNWYKNHLPLCGKKCYEVYHGSDIACDPCPSIRCMQSGKTERDVVTGAPGTGQWIELFAYPMKSPETGEITGVVEFVRDITQRRVAYEALRESEEKYRSLIQNSPDGVFIADRDGRIMSANKAICDVLAVSEERLIGTCVTDFIPDGFKEQYYHRLSELLKGKPYTTPIVYELKLENRGRMEVEVRSVPFFHSGKIVGFQGIVRDITEQRWLERQLLQAQKMEAIGMLAGGVAHDFNNILTVILGYTEAVLSSKDADANDFMPITQIHKAAERASELTRQLLLFSRKQEVKLKYIDLNKTIGNLTKMLKRLIGEDVTLDLKLDSDISAVRADEGNIEQALANLCVNARDAMPGGGRIEISTGNVELSESEELPGVEFRLGRFVRLTVSDTGAGISEEDVYKIFEPFYTTKGMEKGTGMGLSVVYGIIKKHDGWINVESRPGHGTKFEIYLPAESQPAETKTHDAASQESLRGRGEKILFIEDEEGIRRFACEALKRSNYIVYPAGNAKEAEDVFYKHRDEIDFIFSDMVLPDGNGLEVVEKLLKTRWGIPVVMCTGYMEEKIQRIAIEEKGFKLLYKPFGFNELLQIIRRNLDELK